MAPDSWVQQLQIHAKIIHDVNFDTAKDHFASVFKTYFSQLH